MSLTLNTENASKVKVEMVVKFNSGFDNSTFIEVVEKDLQTLFSQAFDLRPYVFLLDGGKVNCADVIKQLLDAYKSNEINEIYTFLLVKKVLRAFDINLNDLNVRLLGKRRLDLIKELLSKYYLYVESEYHTNMRKLFSVDNADDSGIGFVREVCHKYSEEIEAESKERREV